MRLYLILLLLLAALSSNAQQKDLNKIQKILGDDFVVLPSTVGMKTDSVNPVYSRCIEDVVIGHTRQNEYIKIPDTLVREAILPYRFADTGFTSKEEFLEFRTWVRDSIARVKLYYELEGDDEALELLQKDKVDFQRYGGDRDEWISDLDWSYTLDYKSAKAIVILYDMYLPIYQCFRRQKVFDVRKFSVYTNLGLAPKTMVPIFIDSYNWSLKSDSNNFDVWSVLSYLDDQLFLDSPVTNIEPFMAELYCEWKTKEINRLLAKKKIDQRIEFRLPYGDEQTFLGKEQPSFKIPAHDRTENWRITNNEFREFSAYVEDSIWRTYLYFMLSDDSEADKLIQHERYYFSEGDLEYVEWDPSKRELNLDAPCQLDYSVKIKGAFKQEVIDLRSEFDNTVQELFFRYQWIDANQKAVKGKLEADPAIPVVEGMKTLSILNSQENGEPDGEDLRLSGWENPYCTRSHKNLRRFIQRENIRVPFAEKFPENDEIADITYEQALAFYNWKYRIDFFEGNETDNWQQFIFPTEAEFQRIKNGESIQSKPKNVTFDYPVFRTVVEVY